MSEFVDYSRDLMEAAKGFRTRAAELPEGKLKQALLRASLLHGFSFLEAHLNYLAEHFEESTMFSVHEKGILLERDVVFENGKFALSHRSKFSRMVDRIELILEKTSGDPTAAKDNWLSHLKTAIKARNALVHPKEAHRLTDEQLSDGLSAILGCVDALYVAVFKKGLPYKKKGIVGGLEM